MPARASSTWQLQLLGGFALERDGLRLTRLHSRAAVVLLARLALQPQRDHAREELAAALWPEADAPTGLARLRQTLSTLKALLERADGRDGGAVLLADRRALRLVPGALVCDVWHFEAAARARDRATAAACYRGELLPGHYDDWVAHERTRLQALADRLGLDGPLDGTDATTPRGASPGAAQRAAAAPPTPIAAAPAPAPGQTSGLPAAQVGALPAAPPEVDALPLYLTPWFGGDAPAAALAAQVQQHRLVCVQGQGGLGKTRLAVAAARHLQAQGAFDCVRFVAWAGCVAWAEAGARLASALGSPRAGVADLPQALALCRRAVLGRSALLLLDNCEQCGDAVLQAVPALLAEHPGLHLLLTTRRALGLAGEHAVHPAALPCPAEGEPLAAVAGSAAVQLFVARARASRADFLLHEGNAAAVAAVTRRLEGLPLALELAAAQVRTLPPARLLQHLDAPGAARWALLAQRGQAARLAPRQASIEAVVRSSLELLAPPALALLQCLAVVPVPVAAGMAHQLLPGAPALPAGHASVAALDELVAHSLLRAAGDDGLDTWWSLPEPVRDLVAGALPAEAQAQGASAWRGALQAWAPSLAPAWPLASIERAVPVLLAVLRPAQAPPHETLALLLAFEPAWNERSLPLPALDALEEALATTAPGGAGPLAARGHALAATASLRAGRRDAARRHAQALAPAQQAPGDTPDPAAHAARALVRARVAWRADADAPRARAHLAEAAQSAGGDAALEAAVLTLQGTLANEADGDATAAAAAYRQALRWLDTEPQAHGHARRGLRYNLAITDVYAGQPQMAWPMLQALCEEARQAGDRHLLAQALNASGSALQAMQRLDEADAATRAALAEAAAGLETENALYALWNLAPLALQRGDAERAARLMGFADRFWRTHFGALASSDARDVARLRRRCRQQLGLAAGQRCWQEGAALPLAAAIALALG